HLARTARDVPVLLATTAAAPAERVAALEGLGVEVLRLPAAEGRPDTAALLAELGRRRFTNLLVEGRAGVLGALAAAGLIDEVHAFVAPRLLGGAAALSPLGGRGAATVAEGLKLAGWDVQAVEGDVYLHGWR